MKTALLIIDIQNDYFNNGSMSLIDAETAGKNARILLEHFRQKKRPVIHIQHIATRPTATFFIPNTIGADIHECVKPVENEKIIIKHYPNSFRDTDLLNTLTDKHITHLVICGMMTHMCVDATTRAAKDLGYDCTVIGDACATKSLEIMGQKVLAKDVQTSFLAALNYFYSTVVSTQDFVINDNP